MPYKVEKDKKCLKNKETGEETCTKGSLQKYIGAIASNVPDATFTEEEEIAGGKADNMSADDIAKKHGVSVDKIKDQIKMGVRKEKEEHANQNTATATKTATELTKDHLASGSPNYYTNEKNREKKPSKESKSKEANESTKQLIKRLIRENFTKK